jgi:hypothetical protein
MKQLLILFSGLIILSCNYDLQYYRDIVGEWKCDQVLNQARTKSCNEERFRFLEDRSYFWAKEELVTEGFYKIDGNKIHYGELGTQVNSFRIKKIEGDSMIWESLDNPGDYQILFIKVDK